MAIDRPQKTAEHAEDGPVKIAGLIDAKAGSLKAKKGSTKKSESSAEKTNAPADKKIVSPPKSKGELGWIEFMRTASFFDVMKYLKEDHGDLTVSEAVLLRNMATRMLKMTEKAPQNYNQWLDYFSPMTATETSDFIEANRSNMSNEAYAAARRWVEIHDDPSLIDKITQSRLEQKKSEELGNILTAAQSGDRVQTFEALRDNMAYKLQEGSGARDMTVLVKQLNEVMVTLDEMYREKGIKDVENSPIRRIMEQSRKRAHRPRKSRSAATIKEMEAADDLDDEGLE